MTTKMTGEPHFVIFSVFIYFCISGRNSAENRAHLVQLETFDTSA